jgi:phosphoglycolate phosphatase
MPRFRHLIFDLDGTLVDTKADLAAATNYMLAALDRPPLSAPQIAGYVGHGARTLVEKALGPAFRHLADRGFECFMRYYSIHLLDHTRLYDGLDTVLAEAQALGLRLSILTNKPEAPSRAVISGLGLASLFGEIVGGDTLPTKKPDPQGVVYLQRRTGVSLGDTLLIGDSRVDYETGVAAGVAVCGVTWGFGAQDFATLAPRFLVDTAEQLRELILR